MCTRCGAVHGYKTVNDYVDFYGNRYRIRTKSIYHRKHHVENIFNSLCQKHVIEISYVNRQRIYNIFKLIDKVLSQVNGDRKRMISINYILRKLFVILGLPAI